MYVTASAVASRPPTLAFAFAPTGATVKSEATTSTRSRVCEAQQRPSAAENVANTLRGWWSMLNSVDFYFSQTENGWSVLKGLSRRGWGKQG
jgi:hypothetical protein